MSLKLLSYEAEELVRGTFGSSRHDEGYSMKSPRFAHLAATSIAILLVGLSACGGTSPSTTATGAASVSGSETESEVAVDATSSDAYCAAVGRIGAAVPEGGSFTTNAELAATFADYAETIEDVLPAFPDDQAMVLAETAMAVRGFIADPESDTAYEEFNTQLAAMTGLGYDMIDSCGEEAFGEV